MQPPKPRKIYSINQIDIATFFGGPLIAGYLIAENFKTFGKQKQAKQTLWIWWGTTVLVLLAASLMQEFSFEESTLSLGIVFIIAAHLVVKKQQTQDIAKYLKNGYKQASSLATFGKSLVSLLITAIFVVVFGLIATQVNVTYNYSAYLNNYCQTNYKEENILANQVYVPEDASCYVYSKLNEKGFSLEEVDEVLTLEYTYQQERGMVGAANSTSLSEPVNPEANQDYQPVPYIVAHQTFSLSVEEINQVLDKELEYLDKIGVLNTQQP